MLKFIATDIDNNTILIDSISEYELCKDADAPCDSLRLCFLHPESLNELKQIKAFLNDEIVFNGFVDTQREQIDKNGAECFIYARSSACLLVDNEATPCRYSKPSALTLFTKNARELGFLCKLPELICNADYQVDKGTSCFGAINNFIKGLTGKSMTVNAKNELVLASGDDTLLLNDYAILSEKRIINRGRLISSADYKINSVDGYSHHIKSQFLEKRGVFCSRKINLSALPLWQRELKAQSIINDACSSYYTIEVNADGFVSANPYDKAVGTLNTIKSLEGYYVSSVCAKLNSLGETTRITLIKQFDLEEITYVDE